MSVETIQIERKLPIKKWKVFRLLTKIQDYPKFMPNVNSCTVIEYRDYGALVSWNVDADGLPMTWKEEEKIDLDNFVISFESVEGDFKVFRGSWQVQEAEDGQTVVSVTIEIEIGIPLVDQLVQQAIFGKVRKNFESMLESIHDRLRISRYKNISHRKTSDIQGFASIGHPYNMMHLIRILKYFDPQFKVPSEGFLLKTFEIAPSYVAKKIENFISKTGKSANGYFIMCPMIPDMLNLGLSIEQVMDKVYQACKIAEDLGVGILTLGGFTSIAGERFGKNVLERVNVPVTTGNTFTVALVLMGIEKAASLMGIDLSETRVTIIGGSGDIGSGCARILSQKVSEITITGRNERSLMEMERVLSYYGNAQIHTSTNNNDAIKNADIVIAAASTSSSFIDFNNFKSGAIVCDVGYPKNISYTLCNRKDILIFSGGITTIPSEFSLGFDNGMPNSKVLYGCFAEAILLDLEERYENFSFGKGAITKEKVDLITGWASKHGFQVAPFFWGDREVTEAEIEMIARARMGMA